MASRSWWWCRPVPGTRASLACSRPAGRGRAGGGGPGRGRRGGAAGQPPAGRRYRSSTRWTSPPCCAADRVAVEVAPGGQPLRVLTDPLKLRTALGLAERGARRRGRSSPGCSTTRRTRWSRWADPHATPGRSARAGSRSRGARRAVPRGPRAGPGRVGRRCGRLRDPAGLRAARRRRPVDRRPGGGRVVRAGQDRRGQSPARDAGRAPDRGAVRRPGGRARRPSRRTRALGRGRRPAPRGPGRCRPRVRWRRRWSSTSAAARSTPCRRRRDVVAAGAGDLLTEAVAALTGITSAAAEWVKRGPAYRVEAPQVLLAEDGTRVFLDRPAPNEAIGRAGRARAGRAAAVLPRRWRRASGAPCASASRSSWSAATSPAACGRSVSSRASVVVVGGLAGDDEILGRRLRRPAGRHRRRPRRRRRRARPPLRRRLRPRPRSTLASA